MGSGLTIIRATRRCAGGKLPNKFWNEIGWPAVEELFEKLSIERAGGFEIFAAFLSMDEGDTGKVSYHQCNYFIGESMTKYTTRIFAKAVTKENEQIANDLMTFEEFSILVWNYCSYSTLQLAQQLFEIYDVNLTRELGKSDVESMYRMMHDTDDHEEWCIAQFPFNLKGQLKKQDFIQHCGKRNHLIQPAITYQRRVRKKVGGVLYWGSVENARKSIFKIQDSEAATLEDALGNILRYEDLQRKNARVAADSVLANQRLRLAREQEKRAKASEALEEQQKKESDAASMRSDDWVMRAAAHLYSKSLLEFEQDYFTTDDAWARREARADLFSYLDSSREVAAGYWSTREKANILLAEGTQADHEARLQEYVASPAGALHFKYIQLHYVLQVLAEGVRADKHRKGGKSKFAQSQKESAVKMALAELESAGYANTDKFGRKLFASEEPVAKMYGSPLEFEDARTKAHDELYDFHKDKVMAELSLHQTVERNERLKTFLLLEHELVNCHGPRNTKWEMVINHHTKRNVYVNVDTMQSIHRNSAICERCDHVLQQSDEKCHGCEAKRSSKNGKLFRPIGYQNICVD